MVTQQENDLMTRVEGDAPMGVMMREHYWLPFALSSQLVHGEAPLPVRLLGENFVAFRAEDGRVGFLDELCPHRRASLALGRIEGNGVRCIYHGWKVDVSGCVAEAPTQTVRAEQFAKGVPVAHFPVYESGGVVWVWLGSGDVPPFPDLPFAPEDLHRFWCVSRVPCNWLQGVEGTVDSAHANWLHRTWLGMSADQNEEYGNLNVTIGLAPKYETETTAYGMRAVAIRPMEDGGSYVRVTEYMAPFITVVPDGRAQPRDGSMFVLSPVDDTHHLLFYGYYAETPVRPPEEIGAMDPQYVPAPDDFIGLRGDRSNRWGQDRDLMAAGHFTGFGRTLLEEDAAIQTSMGPILDRTTEHLSSSDVAVVQTRRILLEAVAAAGSGELPPGSARSADPVRMPNASEMYVADGERWQDAGLHPAPG